MNTGVKCPKCGYGRFKPSRKQPELIGPYSVRVHDCRKCEKRVVMVTQIVSNDLASKIMEEWDERQERI